MDIIQLFVKSYSSVSYVARQCIQNKEYCEEMLGGLKAEIQKRDHINQQLRDMLQEKIARIESLENEIRTLNRQIEDSHYQAIGITKAQGMVMKCEYEKGMSLRKLAEMFHCDKSTVKRQLIKMGVEIRK